MRKALSILFCLIPCICYSADEWTKTDVALELTFQALNYIDYRQTHYIGDNNEFEEGNIFIGDTPKDHDINTAFATIGLSHALITHILPVENRKVWHYSMIFYKLFVINHNKQIGVKFSF